ncbi:MAG: hypothetical protein V1820_03250 [archaeon]
MPTTVAATSISTTTVSSPDSSTTSTTVSGDSTIPTTSSSTSTSTSIATTTIDPCAGVTCNSGPACHAEATSCYDGDCPYPNAYEGQKDTVAPGLCNLAGRLCCGGICSPNHCSEIAECLSTGSSALAGEESKVSPFNSDIECVYSAASPRAYRHACASPGTCASSCSKTDLGFGGFCTYCPYSFIGYISDNASSSSAQLSIALKYVNSYGTLISENTTGPVSAGYYEQIPDYACLGRTIDLELDIDQQTKLGLGNFIVHNHPASTIENFTKLNFPNIAGVSENGIVNSMIEGEKTSAVSAVEFKVNSTIVKITSAEPTASVRFDYYNITLSYANADVPNVMDAGAKESFSDALDIYKCSSDFFLFGSECTGDWKNSSEISGVHLEKALTPEGGYVKGANYTTFSAFSLGIPIENNGVACARDSDCTTGCCGTPTWEGRRYCTDCDPPSCDGSFCECTGFLDPICNQELPGVPLPPTPTTIPIGCQTDNDCSGCHFCSNSSFDPLTDPYGSNQCLACSTQRDGICLSPSCIGCDPDCCATTPDCAPLGNSPPYFCENTTLDGTALLVGVCRSCETGGNRDSWVPDPVCAGLDNDFCNSSIECVDSNTICACQDDECFFGICMTKRGNFCESDSDCNANTYCSRNAHLCSNNCFLSVSPNRITSKLGNLKIFKLVLADPIGKESTYRVKIVDSGAYSSGAPFASFLDGKKFMTVTVPKNGRKEIPVQFRAAAIGKFNLLFSASSVEFSGASREGINSDQCASPSAASAEITVESEISSGSQFLSAPGLGVAELGLVIVLAGFFFALVDRRR